MSRSPFDRGRRRCLTLLLACPLVAACAANDDEPEVEVSSDFSQSTITTTPGSLSLVALFDASGSTLRAGSFQRLPYALGNRDGMLLRRTPDEFEATITSAGQEIGPALRARKRGQDLTTPYYTLSFTPPESGRYDVVAEVDGERVTAAFTVPADADAVTPQVGDQLPSVHTATRRNPGGVEPLCSREPPCPYHELDLAEVVDTTKPKLVIVASPGFCRSGSCPPVLDLLIERRTALEAADVIHAEVYANPADEETLSTAEPTGIVTTFGLQFEPVLFIADTDGVVTSRLDGVFDGGELDEHLAGLLP